MANESKKDTADREIVITRLLNAPRELVFKVWTDPKHVVKWWGPYGFTNSNKEMEVKPGGVWRFTMHGPDGVDYPNKIVFTEVVAPEKLVYHHDSDDAADPINFEVVVTFETRGNKTLLTMRSLFPTAEELQKVIKEYGAMEGAVQNANRLEMYLAQEEEMFNRQFTLTRTFNASLETVFKAWSDANAMSQWWGPKGFDLDVKKFEFRPGGTFLYSMTAGNNVMWGRFVYQDIQSPNKIAFINSFSDPEGGITRAPFWSNWPLEVFTVVTFEEKDGKTIMTLRGGPINASEDERNKYEAETKNMEQGYAGTIEKLENYLAGR